jgi:hypothetical protein
MDLLYQGLLQGIFNMLLISLLVEGTVSAFFSITAVRSIETKRAVQTTREALTFLVCVLFVYMIESLQLFKACGLKFPHIGDLIISSLVLMRLSSFIRDLMNRVRSGV